MKFPCTLKNALLIIRDHFGLSVASKGLGYLATLLLLLLLLARYKLSCYQTTLVLIISALVDITLLKTTCHFLLLLVGYDTLTYRKELQLISYTCRSSTSKMPMRCTEHQDAFVWVVYLVGEKDERGKALFANLERGVGIFLQNFHSFLPIRQI